MMGRALERYVHFAVYGKRAPRLKRRPRQSLRGPARSRQYMLWIRHQPSIISGAYGVEAAHTGTDGGMRQKASDFSCVPLTAAEHREYHTIGKRAMEAKYGLIFAAAVEQLNAQWRAV